MCGRYTLTVDGDTLALDFELEEVSELAPRYNIAPSQDVPVIVDRDPQRLHWLRWGLVPFWAKDPSIGARMINARLESIDEKNSFRRAFEKRRCLVPADGFFEWQRVAGKRSKEPYYVHREDGQPFAFAGLWERWKGPDGTLASCTIITRPAPESLASLHDRMPVIVPRAHRGEWLSSGPIDKAEVEAWLNEAEASELTFCRVSPVVNKPANDGPECIRPWQEQPSLFGPKDEG
jgi:putative SOS response-associated peptidase YedK